MTHHGFGPIRRVLVVEDDPVCRRYTSEALRQAGSTVKQTGCIRQAVPAALTWRPELVLADLHLPDGSGTELVRRVRAAWPVRQPLPLFVAMTAADPARRDDVLAGGVFFRVLRKPFEPTELAGVLGNIRGPSPGPATSTDSRHGDRQLKQLARREFRRQLPRMTRLLEAGRLDATAALAHRLAASAAVCGALELGRHLQAFSDACLNGPLPAELAETFTTARRLARDFAEGIVPRRGSG